MWSRVANALACTQNDNKSINFDKNFTNYSFNRESEQSLKIKTDYGEEDISSMQTLVFSDTTIDVEFGVKGILW